LEVVALTADFLGKPLAGYFWWDVIGKCLIVTMIIWTMAAVIRNWLCHRCDPDFSLNQPAGA